MGTLTFTGTLVTIECCTCHMIFGAPREFNQERLDDHGWFYCPAGHRQHYTGKSDAEKLRERLEREERRTTFWQDQAEGARRDALHERRRAAAARGQLTKMRNRVARGLCPQQGCRRSFTNLHDHVRGEHPELVEALGDDR